MALQMKQYEEFIRDLLPPFEGRLAQVQNEAIAEKIPIIPHETAVFLRQLMGLIKPGAILEIGTAVGFSAGLFCTFTDATIITIDRYDIMIAKAKENIRYMGFEDRITLLEGSAVDILKTLEGTFDFIFMDAAKGQYIHFLPDCMRLLRTDGLLVADDVLIAGEVTNDRFSVPRRQRTTHKRLRNFLWTITHSKELETSILPIGGGLALCKKKEVALLD